MATRLSPTVTGTCIRFVGFNYANEHVQKAVALRFRKRRQQALLRREQRGAQPVAQVGAAPGRVKLACPSVIRIDLSFDQAFLLEKLDHLTKGDGINTHAARKLSLATSRFLQNGGHDPPKQGCQILSQKDLRRYTETDLMKAAGQMSGHPVRR